mmetsp:Transcript_23083/g.46958  ORF Transcript_23083/g.46958 Transcript_23083/m.46958 type:complete len:222 (+) Transcript_23083:218-883(+)
MLRSLRSRHGRLQGLSRLHRQLYHLLKVSHGRLDGCIGRFFGVRHILKNRAQLVVEREKCSLQLPILQVQMPEWRPSKNALYFLQPLRLPGIDQLLRLRLSHALQALVRVQERLRGFEIRHGEIRLVHHYLLNALADRLKIAAKCAHWGQIHVVLHGLEGGLDHLAEIAQGLHRMSHHHRRVFRHVHHEVIADLCIKVQPEIAHRHPYRLVEVVDHADQGV